MSIGTSRLVAVVLLANVALGLAEPSDGSGGNGSSSPTAGDVGAVQGEPQRAPASPAAEVGRPRHRDFTLDDQETDAVVGGESPYALSLRVAQASPGTASEDNSGGRTGSAPAADKATASQDDLQKASQNPVADLISVPLQSNFNFFDREKIPVGGTEMQYVLNVQPVIPFGLNEDWNLITRTVIPIIYQPEIVPGMDTHGGMGDIQLTGFLSPRKPGRIIWGAGPVMRFPTATDSFLGSEKWSMGPSAVALTMDGPWVYGFLAQNLWSVAGDSGRESVNELLIQPFVNYNLPQGWYLTSSPVITANWIVDADQRWTVPVGGGFGWLFRIGKLPVNMQLGAYYNVERPAFGPEWSVRFQVQFMFPK